MLLLIYILRIVYFNFYKIKIGNVYKIKYYISIVMTNLSLNLIDEISIIILWIGIWGITDMFINIPIVNEHKQYIYILLILTAIYFKL
jgi:hypothetical protein